ncbi:VWA domain-containing protein [Nocardiopsis ganjiahuensis]|uniref:VWA domain-containing protein n=1 Tax=Nocardiopsis ganjiahuensis TaxID=239984 RepID=UPI00034B9839|nr:VWA domain-containing protein [Nocardiopsis ganjiahuensis]
MRVRAWGAALAVLVLASACTAEGGGGVFGGDRTLRVLAGSELADMEEVLAASAERTGVRLELEYTGTLDGTERIAAAGDAGVASEGGEPFDAVWFPSNRYLHLVDQERSLVDAETSVMVSPVVFGVVESRAEELGWTDDDLVRGVTWGDVAEAVSEEGLTYGMSNPAASNSGFSALIGAASAMADTGAALEAGDVERVGPELAEFFSGQEMTAGSSGWLMEEFARRQERGGAAVDGVVNYESVLMSHAASGEGRPLALVYPEDGVVTADYPLTLLAGASDEAAADYEEVVADLLGAEAQSDIVERTFRRPVSAEVAAEDFPDLVELPFPARREVVDDLVAAYFAELRRPSRTVYVLDVSGSMEGQRIGDLRTALVALTGADEGSLSERAQLFQDREEVTLLPFSTEPWEPSTFVLEPGSSDGARADLAAEVAALEAGGETAAYDAVAEAFSLLAKGGGDDHLMSVVLMTDGEVNQGAGLDELVGEMADLPSEVASVPVYPVLFGEGNGEEMETLALVSGGRVFDARQMELERIFREIRGYQ